MNIVLCGLPGAGKTTVGKILAEKAGWSFVDTDRLTEELSKQRCYDLYLQHGEEVFRKTESCAILQLQGVKNNVIATGGGSLLLGQNVTFLKGLGPLVYLQAPPDQLYRRLSAKGPPAYLDPQAPEQAYQRIARQRKPIFETWADLTISVGERTPEQIASEIWRHYGQ